MVYVYGLCRKADNTIRYVGITQSKPITRFNSHRSNAKNGMNLPVYKWMRKYDDVIQVILHKCESRLEANELEKLEIKSRNNLLNCTPGGDGGIGFKHSEETLAKLSKLFSGVNNPNYGKPRSIEVKEKLRLSNLGKTMPKETREKISNSTRGIPKSLEMRSKLSASKTGVKRIKIECPHCGVFMSAGNVNRYHFDNCKKLTAQTERT